MDTILHENDMKTTPLDNEGLEKGSLLKVILYRELTAK